MKISRRYTTLLETLIALTLMTLLLSALLGSWAFSTQIRARVAKQEEKSFRELALGTRLTMLLTSPSTPKEKPFAFYTEEKEGTALIFTYDYHTGQGSTFSNTVLGKLFVDKEKRLTLLTWPSPKRESTFPIPCRREILLHGAESISFEFIFLEGDVQKSLPIDNDKLPLVIIVKIKEKGNRELSYQFLISNSQKRIIYP